MIDEKKRTAAKESLHAKGITVKEWADNHKFPVQAVYGVLQGRYKARNGQGHRIAVALGLK